MSKQNIYFSTACKFIVSVISCSIIIVAISAFAFHDSNNRHSLPEQRTKITVQDSIVPLAPTPDYEAPPTETSEEAANENPDETELAEQIIDFRYPVGKLLLSGRREAYASGDMTLEIPRLNLVCKVLDGTEPDTLDKGVCLFEYAQLPGIINSNTSVVAHRDIYGREFLNIHKITDGDLMHLTYEGKKYTYEYLETLITDSSDWNLIRVRDFACITLQSCDPIGIATERIFVTGKLIGVEDDESES